MEEWNEYENNNLARHNDRLGIKVKFFGIFLTISFIFFFCNVRLLLVSVRSVCFFDLNFRGAPVEDLCLDFTLLDFAQLGRKQDLLIFAKNESHDVAEIFDTGPISFLPQKLWLVQPISKEVDPRGCISTYNSAANLGTAPFDAIFGVFAAVLHMGNIEFAKGKEMDSSTSKDEKSWFHLKTTAELFM
ncbi:hypothetical protein L1987_77636 [Smallanthus sonchifolius]|uniref:Uncharacterized protein n=1 Tax=Smallanthus sonchifolius TaxID=185202 RepID=A0ACB8ZBE6_9ASTR|nr:hypothetical protein L1987_77636 [Smallanthus sonchifolius]